MQSVVRCVTLYYGYSHDEGQCGIGIRGSARTSAKAKRRARDLSGNRLWLVASLVKDNSERSDERQVDVRLDLKHRVTGHVSRVHPACHVQRSLP